MALGAGMLGFRCSEHGLEGRGSRWPHPLVLSGCLHLVAGVGGVGGVQPRDDQSRASKPVLL